MFGFGKKQEAPKKESKEEEGEMPKVEIDIENLPIQAIEWDWDKAGSLEGTWLVFMIPPKDRDNDVIRGSLVERHWFNTTEDEHNRLVRRFRRKLGLTDDGTSTKDQR